MITITSEQRDNLAKLAAFLRENAPSIGFDMSCYAIDNEGNMPTPLELVEHPCGSVGCAIGHGPIAGIKPIDEEEGWNSYSHRAFGASSFKNHPAPALWYGLFDDSWADVDNTALGAAQRIERFLQTGELRNSRGTLA